MTYSMDSTSNAGSSTPREYGVNPESPIHLHVAILNTWAKRGAGITILDTRLKPQLENTGNANQNCAFVLKKANSSNISLPRGG